MTLPYQWIFFDADGTLYDFDIAEISALNKTFEDFNHPFLPEHQQLYAEINERLWTQFEQGLIGQEKVVIKRFADLFECSDIMLDPKSFNERYLQNLGAQHELLPGAEQLLKTLYGKVSMLLITNGVASVQRNRFSKSSLTQYFSHIVISEEVGAVKPHPRIFEAAFHLAGNPAKDSVLMVGDSLNADIKGAHDLGVDTCWFNPHNKPRPPGLDIQFEINELCKLLQILNIELGDCPKSYIIL